MSNTGNNSQKKTSNAKPQSRVFVDLPDGNVITKGSKKDHYLLRIKVGLASGSDSTRTRIYVINGENRMHVKSHEVKTTVDLDLPEVKLDLTKPVQVEVEKAGHGNAPDARDFLDIPRHSVQDNTSQSSKAANAKLLETKFIRFAQGGQAGLILVTKKDKDGKPCGGDIEVFLGQGGRIDSQTTVTGKGTAKVPNSGRHTLEVYLGERDGVVVITDPSTGESCREFMRKG